MNTIIYKPSTSPNHPSSLFPQISRCKTTRQLKQIHAHFIKTGQIHHPLAAAELLKFLALSTQLEIKYARKFFSPIHHPNCFSWNTITRALADSGDYDIFHVNPLEALLSVAGMVGTRDVRDGRVKEKGRPDGSGDPQGRDGGKEKEKGRWVADQNCFIGSLHPLTNKLHSQFLDLKIGVILIILLDSVEGDWNVEHRCLDTMVSKNSMFDDEPGSGGHAITTQAARYKCVMSRSIQKQDPEVVGFQFADHIYYLVVSTPSASASMVAYC
ncbi:hypothetical protein DKX38_017260 [Salix brachista]|uniref:Uncharacterized protein n=1 Tax=Salix brachista TaxID=2182728 RepID=A0A5N5KUS1_9ROSI|nr:hypothetical protein DKX38_017260 [Salix brachista]